MARRDVSLQYTTEKTFDWGQLVKEDRGLRVDPAPRLTRRRGHAAAALLPAQVFLRKSRRARGVGRGCSGACSIETLHTSGRRY